MLARHYRWPHDFWRRMGLVEYRAWLGATERTAEGARTAPGSWDGHEADPAWQEMRRKHRQRMGRTG